VIIKCMIQQGLSTLWAVHHVPFYVIYDIDALSVYSGPSKSHDGFNPTARLFVWHTSLVYWIATSPGNALVLLAATGRSG
jgi:hypothetical protein